MLPALGRKAIRQVTGGNARFYAQIDQEAMDMAKQVATKIKETAAGAVEGAKHYVQDIKESATGSVEGAKHYVQDAEDRVKHEKEGLTDTIKSKAQQMSEKLEDFGQRVADSSSSDTTPTSSSTTTSSSTSSSKLPSAEDAAGKRDKEPIGTMPAGTNILDRSGTHLYTDREGKQASMT